MKPIFLALAVLLLAMLAMLATLHAQEPSVPPSVVGACFALGCRFARGKSPSHQRRLAFVEPVHRGIEIV